METLVLVFARVLRVDFDDLRSSVGPRSQLESYSVRDILCPSRALASLSQRNDLWKEFSENRSILTTRNCTSNCVRKKNDFGEMPNWKVVVN